MNIANDYWRVKEPHNQLLGNNQFQCRVFNEPKSRAEMDAINLVFEQTIEEDPSTGAIYQGKDSHFGHVIDSTCSNMYDHQVICKIIVWKHKIISNRHCFQYMFPN